MTASADLLELGIEAYVYLYPIVTMDVSRRIMCNVPPDAKPGMGPAGVFHHMRAFPDAEFKAVVRPNFDTLYSSAWLDLTQGPVVMSVPDTQGRYYLLPIYDMWTDAFAVPGTRTSGDGAGSFAIVPAGWQGDLPAGMERIDAPTPYLWIIGRTQTNGPADYAAVHAVQDCFTLTPLATWPNQPEPPALHARPDGGHEDPAAGSGQQHERPGVFHLRRRAAEAAQAARDGLVADCAAAAYWPQAGASLSLGMNCRRRCRRR